MKKILYLPLLAGFLMTLGACDGTDYDIEEQIPERFHKILYLNVSGKQELTLYNTDEDNIYSFSVIKAGSDIGLAADAEVNVLTQEEVDNQYGQLEGVNYKIIDKDIYSIDETHLDFSAKDNYKLVNISLNPQKVMNAMLSEPTAKWVLPLILNSRSDSINANKKELFLQLKEVITPAIGFTNTTVVTKEYTYGRVSTIEDVAQFKLDTDNKWDIECQFGVNEEYIATYNATNNTNFKMLPEGTYSFSSSLSLSKGTSTLKLPIKIEGDRLAPGDYMLPVQIKNTSRFEVAADKSVYPMAIHIMGVQFDRNGWTATASTEEPTGELGDGKPEGNGVAGCILDGNVKSYWHSQWQGNGANPPLPHTVIVDTKSEHTFSHFALIQRTDGKYTKTVEFYVSSESPTLLPSGHSDRDIPDNWGQKVGTCTVKQEDGSQVFGVTQATGRYIVIRITESYNNNNATLAEFYAYGIE